MGSASPLCLNVRLHTGAQLNTDTTLTRSTKLQHPQVYISMHLCLICDCRLLALPQYKRRAAAAAAAATHTPPTGCDAVADGLIEQFLTAGKALDYPPGQRQALQSQWTKVLRRLQKAEEVRTRVPYGICQLKQFKQRMRTHSLRVPFLAVDFRLC
jgi:hypothetical protein